MNAFILPAFATPAPGDDRVAAATEIEAALAAALAARAADAVYAAVYASVDRARQHGNELALAVAVDAVVADAVYAAVDRALADAAVVADAL